MQKYRRNYSSASIGVHLVTTEVLTIYLEHLAYEGIITAQTHKYQIVDR